MTERISAWQCIGCGRIEGAQPCIGICEDRKREFVHAAVYDDLAAELSAALASAHALAGIVRRIACITPREGDCERTYRALQTEARAALKSLGDVEQGGTASALVREK
jgi:hypothetical protein